MKKKVWIAVVSVFVAVLIVGSLVAYPKLPHSLNYDFSSVKSIGSEVKLVHSWKDEITIQKDGEDFKVLLFTDIHLDGNNDTSNLTLSNLVDNIRCEKPDLVLFGGDNVTSAFNRKRAKQFCQLFENAGVYWAGVLGNHEGDNGFSLSRSEMMDLFMSYDHCLMKKGVDGIFGDCNYALNILNSDGSLKHTFYFLDTGDEMSEELKAQYGIPAEEDPYDGTKPEQVRWYTEKNEALKEKYGEFKSTLVIHIPLPQMETAAKDGEFLYGEKREGICESGFDSGLFDALKEGGTTGAAFFGHDHLNDFGVEYDDILLSYIQPSGYGSYTSASKLGYEEKDWLQGYTALQLNSDGSFASYRVRNSQKDAQ